MDRFQILKLPEDFVPCFFPCKALTTEEKKILEKATKELRLIIERHNYLIIK